MIISTFKKIDVSYTSSKLPLEVVCGRAITVPDGKTEAALSTTSSVSIDQQLINRGLRVKA